MTGGPGLPHLRGRRERARRVRWRWVALAVTAAAVALLAAGSHTGTCFDAVAPAASSCTTSPSGAARVLIGLVGACAVVVLLRRAFRRR